MSKVRNDRTSFIGVIIVIIIVGLFLYMSVAAPCWVYSFVSNKEVPARCVDTFKG